MIQNWILILVALSLLLPAVVTGFLAISYRRKGKAYTSELGLDHFAKLAGSFSLILAAIALIYTYKTQQVTERTTAEMNRKAAQDAQEQTQLLHDAVTTLHSAVSELSVTADASNR